MSPKETDPRLREITAKNRVINILREDIRIFYPEGQMYGEIIDGTLHLALIGSLADRIVRNVMDALNQGVTNGNTEESDN
jgi:hypothetical protein